MKIAHVALWTRNLTEAATFWATYFDAKIGERYDSGNRPGFSSHFLTFTDGATLELMTGPWLPEATPGERPGWAHVAMSVGSREAVEALAARLETAGLLVAQPRMTGDGYYEALARSPDGTLVEILP